MALAFQDKVVIVTGGSRGIGKATATLFAEAGAAVVICSRDANTYDLPHTAEDAAAAIRGGGGRALALRIDVANDDDVRTMIDRTMSEFGRIDIVVNNAVLAAFGGSYGFLDGDGGLALLDEAYRVNLRAPYLISQLAAAKMAAAGGGIIVNVSSPNALPPADPTVPSRGSSPSYGITKAGLDRFSTAITGELKEKNIAVITLYPRGTVTERISRMLPPERLATMETPEMSAKAILFLCEDPMAHTGKILWTAEVLKEHGL